MAKRKRRRSRSRSSREMMLYAPPVAQENPLGTGMIIAIIAGVAAVGVVAYVALKPKTAAAAGTPGATGTRTAGALDNYSVTLTDTAQDGTLAYMTPASFPVAGATVVSMTPAADGNSAVAIMTAPPGSATTLAASVATYASIVGATVGPITDTGVAVQ